MRIRPVGEPPHSLVAMCEFTGCMANAKYVATSPGVPGKFAVCKTCADIVDSVGGEVRSAK